MVKPLVVVVLNGIEGKGVDIEVYRLKGEGIGDCLFTYGAWGRTDSLEYIENRIVPAYEVVRIDEKIRNAEDIIEKFKMPTPNLYAFEFSRDELEELIRAWFWEEKKTKVKFSICIAQDRDSAGYVFFYFDEENPEEVLEIEHEVLDLIFGKGASMSYSLYDETITLTVPIKNWKGEK